MDNNTKSIVNYVRTAVLRLYVASDLREQLQGHLTHKNEEIQCQNLQYHSTTRTL